MGYCTNVAQKLKAQNWRQKHEIAQFDESLMFPDKRTKYVFNCKSFKSALTLIFVAILEYQIMIFLKSDDAYLFS